MGEDEDDIVTEEMLWDRIPTVTGLERANTFYELSARIYARGQYDEALALAETARDIYAELPAETDGLAQAYSAIGYNLNQLRRTTEAASAMSKAVDLLRNAQSPIAIELACTLGEWWYGSKEYAKVIECMAECVREHQVDGDDLGAANDLYLIGCAQRELKEYVDGMQSFQSARALFKKLKDVINVARCDHKIASIYYELGDGEAALAAATKATDVFTTAHDHRRETYALLEIGKAQVLIGKCEEGLETLERVLEITSDAEWREMEFIVEVERKIVSGLRALGRESEAAEIERRLLSVTEILED
jgi:tetratricopeptide (TPR) repeat protein